MVSHGGVIMALSDTQVRGVKPSSKPFRLTDGGGLYLEVSPAGGKLWRLRYRFNGKGKLLALGKYPDVGLKEARERRDEAKKLLANGQDPGEVKKMQKAAIRAADANSFEATARAWFANWKTDKASNHAKRVIAYLENDVFPWLGKTTVEILGNPKTGRPLVKETLQRIYDRGATDATDRVKGIISMVMQEPVRSGLALADPTAKMGESFPHSKKHFPFIKDPAKFGEFLRAIDGYGGSYVVRAALKLLPMVFCRPCELRLSKWTDFDLDGAMWEFVASKTKVPHDVPLARQAVAILRDLYPLTGHDGGLVFKGERQGRPISENTLNAALRNMGYDTQTEICAHGLRATAATMLSERLKKPVDWIDKQLAHKQKGEVRQAYFHADYRDDRIPMMQEWADYLDSLKAGARPYR
jgi:integrase